MRITPALALCLLATCSPSDRPVPAPADTLAAAPSAVAAPHEDPARPLLERADLLVTLLAGILERDDAEALVPFVTPEGWPPDTAAAQATLADYRHHFRDRPLAGWYRVRLVGDSAAAAAAGTTLHYELLAHGGARKTIAVSYDPIRDRLRVHDEFLLHSRRVHHFADAVAAALRTSDAPALARLLSPDDVDYPVESARRAIERYGAELDLATLRIRYDGLVAPGRAMRTTDVARPFRFVIEGTRAGTPVRHEVLVPQGDGLLGWRDAWMPGTS